MTKRKGLWKRNGNWKRIHPGHLGYVCGRPIFIAGDDMYTISPFEVKQDEAGHSSGTTSETLQDVVPTGHQSTGTGQRTDEDSDSTQRGTDCWAKETSPANRFIRIPGGIIRWRATE